MLQRVHFLNAVILSCQAVIEYAERYAELASKMAAECTDPVRKQELLQIVAELQSRACKRSDQLLRGMPVLLVCTAAAPDGVQRTFYFTWTF